MSEEVDFMDILWENKCLIYIGTNKEFGRYVREEDS